MLCSACFECFVQPRTCITCFLLIPVLPSYPDDCCCCCLPRCCCCLTPPAPPCPAATPVPNSWIDIGRPKKDDRSNNYAIHFKHFRTIQRNSIVLLESSLCICSPPINNCSGTQRTTTLVIVHFCFAEATKFREKFLNVRGEWQGFMAVHLWFGKG